MSSKTLDTLQGLRGFLEDMVSPSVRQIQSEVKTLHDICERLGEEMLEHRKDNKELLVFMQEQVSSLSSRIGRLEGRSEGLKEELTAVLQLELLKVFQGGLGAARAKAFLDDGEPKA